MIFFHLLIVVVTQAISWLPVSNMVELDGLDSGQAQICSNLQSTAKDRESFVIPQPCGALGLETWSIFDPPSHICFAAPTWQKSDAAID
jgi:hypothetical protein